MVYSSTPWSQEMGNGMEGDRSWGATRREEHGFLVWVLKNVSQGAELASHEDVNAMQLLLTGAEGKTTQPGTQRQTQAQQHGMGGQGRGRQGRLRSP
jgi:hypothetical protein